MELAEEIDTITEELFGLQKLNLDRRAGKKKSRCISDLLANLPLMGLVQPGIDFP